MFNNPFLKKDPLLEAVQSAMQDGEIRRQAEALVNEEFGVYSRNAVVREHLAAYDAALEEAYKCMKEGNKENKEKKRDVEASTGAAYKKMGFDGRGSKGRHPENKRHDDIGLGRKVMKFGEEAKKLADKDYDKDGKIESPKDEVWGSRFRAAKMAGKKGKEGISKLDNRVTGIERANKRMGVRYEETMRSVKADPNDPSYQGGGDVTSSAPKHVRPSHPEKLKNLKDPRDPSVQGSGDVTFNEELSHDARELTMYADNHAQLHRSSHQPIVKNLQRKHAKGAYDHSKAEKLWGYHAKRAADSYHKEHGHKFSVADRKEAARHMAASARDEHGFGTVKEGTKIVSKGYGKVEVVRDGKKVKAFKDPRDAKMFVAQKVKKAIKEAKIDPVHAKEILDKNKAHGDFHSLGSSTVSSLVDTAKKMKYRKGSSAPGSTGRMFHQHLTRLASKVRTDEQNISSSLPKSDSGWEGVKTREVTMNDAREARKSLEGSKGEIRKDNKYPGL